MSDSETDVESSQGGPTGDAWEHIAPSMPLDHPQAAAVMKELKEQQEDEEWATNATRKYALIWCFKKWDAGGESFYQMMPNDVLRKVIAEALRHPLTNVAFNGNTPLISFHPSALREFEVEPATAQFLKVNRKAACSIATVRRFLINTDLGNFMRLLHILADYKFPQVWLSNHTWDGLDLCRVAVRAPNCPPVLPRIAPTRAAQPARRPLVTGELHGNVHAAQRARGERQVRPAGQERDDGAPRRAPSLPLSWMRDRMGWMCAQVRSPMIYPKVPWTMGPRSSTEQYFNDARSFASDSSALLDEWHEKYDEPPDWYVEGDYREPEHYNEPPITVD